MPLTSLEGFVKMKYMIRHPHSRSTRILKEHGRFIPQYLASVRMLPFIKYWENIPLDNQPIMTEAYQIFHYNYGKLAKEASIKDPDYARAIIGAYWRIHNRWAPPKVLKRSIPQ